MIKRMTSEKMAGNSFWILKEIMSLLLAKSPILTYQAHNINYKPKILHVPSVMKQSIGGLPCLLQHVLLLSSLLSTIAIFG